jgi:hypothetical protein
MQSLQSAVGRELRWQPRSAFSHTYDLVDPRSEGVEPYATLVWRPGFFLSGPAEASSGDGNWRFHRRGVVRGRIVVTAGSDETSLGTVRRYWRRAVLRLESGREYVWRRESFWSLVRRFEDSNGTPVVRLRRALWPPAGAARVEIEASAADASERALLACLGWYMSLIDSHRRAARAGAASSGV